MAVDVHVRRVTENLGVADTRGLTLGRDVKRRVQSAWQEAVSAADFGGPLQIAGTCANPQKTRFGDHRSINLRSIEEPVKGSCHRASSRTWMV